MSSLTVAARFCGPPGTANGGWLAGRLAASVPAGTVAVRLRRPTPLERPLDLRRRVPTAPSPTASAADRTAGPATPSRRCSDRCRTPPLLGTLVARQERPVRLDAEHVLLAWALDRDGRRVTSASAVVGPDGEVCARARATWFAVPRGRGRSGPGSGSCGWHSRLRTR